MQTTESSDSVLDCPRQNIVPASLGQDSSRYVFWKTFCQVEWLVWHTTPGRIWPRAFFDLNNPWEYQSIFLTAIWAWSDFVVVVDHGRPLSHGIGACNLAHRNRSDSGGKGPTRWSASQYMSGSYCVLARRLIEPCPDKGLRPRVKVWSKIRVLIRLYASW